MSTPLLQLLRVEKSFPGVRALRPVDLQIDAGEVLGLVGENGAGKSTLIKILSGVHRADAGNVLWEGRGVLFESPGAAIEAGIATIHQEIAGAARLTIGENLLLGERWPRRRWGGVDWRRLHDEATRRLRAFDVGLSSTRLFSTLTAAQRQEVAIACALSRESRLLILDEPTASLSDHEVEQLFARLRGLRERGVAVLYISHRLEEILELTDRVAVLRDGELVAISRTSDVGVGDLVRAMVGRSLEQIYPRTRGEPARDVVLELDGATCEGMFRDISFRVRSGEIVGLGGLVGAGRSEIARAIFGLYRLDAGAMRLHGEPWLPSGPHESLRRGLVYLPEERKRQSLVLDHGLGASVRIGFSDLLTRSGLVPRRACRDRVSAAISRHGIRSTGPSQAVGTLSGGNQQKAVLARWLERGPDVLILDEPTRGVDVSAKAEIHETIDRLAAQGKAVVLVSSDLPELLGMSDRVLVLREGRAVAELPVGSATQEQVLLAASGLSPPVVEGGEAP